MTTYVHFTCHLSYPIHIDIDEQDVRTYYIYDSLHRLDGWVGKNEQERDRTRTNIRL